MPRQRFAAAVDCLSLRGGAENRSEIMSRSSPPRSVRGPAVVLGTAGGDGALSLLPFLRNTGPSQGLKQCWGGLYLFIYFKCRVLRAVWKVAGRALGITPSYFLVRGGRHRRLPPSLPVRAGTARSPRSAGRAGQRAGRAVPAADAHHPRYRP